MGVEAYLAPRGMQDRDPQKDRQRYHLLLLAKNMTGYKNLLKLSSLAQLEGFYYKPRIDKETLAAHAEGLIARPAVWRRRYRGRWWIRARRRRTTS